MWFSWGWSVFGALVWSCMRYHQILTVCMSLCVSAFVYAYKWPFRYIYVRSVKRYVAATNVYYLRSQ